MPATTILIQMTGLLLLSPSQRTGELPMYVMMPQPGQYVPPHNTHFGYYSPSSAGCESYDASNRICYVSMAGWSLTIGTLDRHPPQRLLPDGVLNLTALSGRFVPSTVFAEAPGTSQIQGRIVLNEGEPVNACDQFWWNVGEGPPRSLTNVLDWQITGYRSTSLVLVRKSLTDPKAPPEAFATVRADHTGYIRLYIRNEPSAGPGSHATVGAGAARFPAGYGLDPMAGPGSPAVVGARADHFRAGYDLLGATNGVIPTIQDLDGPQKQCRWGAGGPSARRGGLSSFGSTAWRNLERSFMAAPGAPTCLMVSGLP